MRKPTFIALCLGGAVALAACERPEEAEVERALSDIDVIDESNMSDIMLTVADPDEAVGYFRSAAARQPGRIDLQRGLATSLVRAKQPAQAAGVWRRVVDLGGTNEDRVALAGALIRSGDWQAAETALQSVPAAFESVERLRLEAMISDSREDWARADEYYAAASSRAPQPAGILNNWGFSKLSRGAFEDAERLFGEALNSDPTLFTAKNNLVLARGAQRDYDLPVVPMSQVERAQLLHSLALTAIKQGDVGIGRGLLNDAVETHPRHFEVAARALDALGSAPAN